LGRSGSSANRERTGSAVGFLRRAVAFDHPTGVTVEP
jgi:hypothetical protein